MQPLAWSSTWNNVTAGKSLHLSSLQPGYLTQSALLCHRTLLTITQDSHILVVKAVVDSPASAATLTQSSFLPTAVHVVQQDGASALPKGKGPRHRERQAAAQLTTYHIGVHHVPVIVTNAAPGATMQDLQTPPAAARTPHQPQFCGEG